MNFNQTWPHLVFGSSHGQWLYPNDAEVGKWSICVSREVCEPQPAWTARFLGLGLGYSPTVCVLPPLLFYSLSFHFPAKLSTGPLLKHMPSSLSVAPYMSLHPLSCVSPPPPRGLPEP